MKNDVDINKVEVIKSQKARLCVDYLDEDSFKATLILREAGLRVTATPVSGLAGPELTLGSTTYSGITEIQQLVQDLCKK